MTRPKSLEDYRQLAVKCRETARTAAEEKAQADLLAMAEIWDLIADRIPLRPRVLPQNQRIETTSNVDCRVMPIADGRWYWEVITSGPTVIARGVADTKRAASREASEAARIAKLNPTE